MMMKFAEIRETYGLDVLAVVEKLVQTLVYGYKL